LTANEIKALRKKLGLSQQEFATKLLRSTTIVSRWENGAASPDKHSLAALRKLAKSRAKR
jgi:DNA-binding transcriptional regulator YiaG